LAKQILKLPILLWKNIFFPNKKIKNKMKK
jgi:hypothetical protein